MNRRHAPYITACPEVNCRVLPRDGDTHNVLILATDGVWERASGEDVLRWVKNYYDNRIADKDNGITMPPEKDSNTKECDAAPTNDYSFKSFETFNPDSRKRKLLLQTPPHSPKVSMQSTVSDVIVRRVLNKVRRSRKLSSLRDLISLPKGWARRSKHDDITTTVVDLSSFV